MSYTIDQVVSRYIEMRDDIKKDNDAFAEKMKPRYAAMQVLEQWMLAYLNQSGQEAARTEAGTAYKTTVLSTRVEDWDRLMRYILGGVIERGLNAVENGGEWDWIEAFRSAPELNFLIRGVNKTAVTEFMEAHEGEGPPGVKLAQIIKVGVRRS